MKKLFAIALTAITFAACSKKEQTTVDPVYTYSQILDSLPITIGKKYVVAYYTTTGSVQFMHDTVIFLADNWVNEKTDYGQSSFRIDAYMKKDVSSSSLKWKGKIYLKADTFTAPQINYSFYKYSKDSISITHLPNRYDANPTFNFDANYSLYSLE